MTILEAEKKRKEWRIKLLAACSSCPPEQGSELYVLSEKMKEPFVKETKPMKKILLKVKEHWYELIEPRVEVIYRVENNPGSESLITDFRQIIGLEDIEEVKEVTPKPEAYKPLSVVCSPAGNLGVITDVNNNGRYSVRWFTSGIERNAWWDHADLEFRHLFTEESMLYWD